MSAALITVVSCNDEDEYYENGNYTLAAQRKTRCLEGGGRKDMEI